MDAKIDKINNRDRIYVLLLTLVSLMFSLFSFSAVKAFAGIDKNSVGIWLFDEGKAEKINDLTSNHNDGKIQGDVKWVKGKFGMALEFNGNGSGLIPNSPSLNITEQITLEAWITFTDAGKGQDMVIARIEPSYSLQKFNNDQIEGWVSIAGWKGVRGLAGGQILKPNTWYHVAFSYDGNLLKTYVNGEADRESKVSGKLDVVNAPFTIGSYKGEAYFWRGVIDEVRVSNTVRSQKEVKASMEGFEKLLGVEAVGKLAIIWGKVKKPTIY